MDDKHNHIDEPFTSQHNEDNVLHIDKRTLKILNDPNCVHEWVDDDDEIGNMRAQICLKCPIGRWVSK